jgi:hypothetical protein
MIAAKTEKLENSEKQESCAQKTSKSLHGIIPYCISLRIEVDFYFF